VRVRVTGSLSFVPFPIPEQTGTHSPVNNLQIEIDMAYAIEPRVEQPNWRFWVKPWSSERRVKSSAKQKEPRGGIHHAAPNGCDKSG